MGKQLSLVELATYGYVPSRVNKGSWLEEKFGGRSKGEMDNGHIRRTDKGKIEHPAG